MGKRKRVFWTLWLSYIVILVIPITISIYLYSTIKNVMIDNASRSNFAMLEQVRQVIDSHMEEIDQLIVQISSHPKLQALWNIDEGEDYILYTEAVATLKNIRFGNGFIEDFYVHYKNGDTILKPAFKTNAETYFSKVSQYGSYTTEEVKEKLLSGYHFKSFMPSEAIYGETSPKNAIATVVSLPLGELQNIRSTLVMLIDEQQIFDLLKQIEWVNRASMYVLDHTGKVLLSSTGEYVLPEGVMEQAAVSGYHSFVLNGEEMMLSSTKGTKGWQFISLVPKEVVLQPITNITYGVISLFGIAVLIGTLVAYWMAYRSYGPIRDMVTVLVKGKGKAAEVAVNEYDFIKSSIKNNMEEKEKLRLMLADHAPVVLAHFLNRLLNGQIESEQLEQSDLEFMGLSLPYRLNCVILVTCDDSSQFRKEDSEREWALVRFILLNLCGELMEGKGYVVETKRNQLALMVNMSDNAEEAVQLREAIITDLKKVTEDRFRMKITIASSMLHQGMESFGKCYTEATSALDYKIVHGIGSIIYYEQIKDLEHSYYYYPMEEEVRLINYLKNGNYDEAERLLDMLYEKNKTAGELTSEMGKFLIFDLLSTVIKVMEALKIDGRQLLHGIDPIHSIMDGASMQEMIIRTKQLCKLICARVEDARQEQLDEFNEQIKEYISSHILDDSLSLTSIADHFNMNSQYISSYFKKQNDVNVSEFITAKRMEEAKLMLRHSDWSVMQIALKICYANDIGFIRAFKKYEGITPGKYREMVRNLADQESGTSER
ncbi:hypothetical protein B1748_09025 [Paenibacillus sp. MY03]|uniref:AraC family transcriptional regulator n=1 Tax=Paenibacillus sp. MY03 TaxID=302980 RepID=UPI000B3C110F|nr:helix-turn-helix domain-containing protein [Paenibacillus sp. MY03]OUS77274.1 hypothetical protein B1748_09025 [Paenibacillus sp. MY03]